MDSNLSLFDPPDGSTVNSAAADASKAPPASKRVRNRKLLIGIVSLLTVFTLIAGGVVAYYARSVDRALSQTHKADLLPTAAAPTVPQVAGEAMNVVLMGSDRRTTDELGRSDSLMVLHISGDRKNAYLISFPRDMWVDIPGHGTAKINAAFSYGGAPLAIQTLQQLTNVKMDHAVQIDFNSFVGLIDEIGGVRVYNKQASSEHHVSFPEGWVNLTGSTALVYCRQRYTLKNGDFDRAARQRDVIKAVLEKVMSPAILANPAKFRTVSAKMAPYFTVDKTLTPAVIEKLALSMRMSSMSELRTLQAPVSGFGVSSDGQDYDVVNTRLLNQMSTALRNDNLEPYYQEHKNDPALTPP